LTINYATLDNRDLLRLADEGDEGATAQLGARGNTIVDATTLARTIKGSDLIGYPGIKSDDVVTVHNGKVVEVNGNPYP
jgi:hypothetical protein